MNFTTQLKEALAPFQMLTHPFYQAWMQGELTVDDLQKYSSQYKPFVDAFPRFVSRIHSQCEDPATRHQLLMNLVEEEGFPRGKDHPTLWKQFATGMGVSSYDFENGTYNEASKALVDTFWKHCNSSYAEGLAALYTYEHQIPEIAKAKIEGLKKFYGVTAEATTEFFSVHEEADVLHSESCEALLNQLPAEVREKALAAATESAQALWNFLTHCTELKSTVCHQPSVLN
ncbi:MAG: CADD family putative folate metabolism protein [Pseudobdellovibrionaceae bacterium]